MLCYYIHGFLKEALFILNFCWSINIHLEPTNYWPPTNKLPSKLMAQRTTQLRNSSQKVTPWPDICHLLCWLCLCKCTMCVMLHAGLWRPRPPGNFPLRISEQTFLSTSRYLSPHSKFSFWNSWLTLVLKDRALQSVLEKWLRIPSLLQRQEVWPPNILERWLE